ncbi:MAG: hypothetical protein R6W96_06185 [Clostridia bacterium]
MVGYYYVEKEKTNDIISCGIKLSEYMQGQVEIDSVSKSFYFAYITPKDNMARYNGNEHVCLRIEIPEEKLYVGEKIYHETGKTDWFTRSVKPAGEYKVGEYRKPRFLVIHTLFGDQVRILDKNRDVPALYENSEEMYFQRVHSIFEESDKKFYDRSLLGYFNILNHLKIAKVEETQGDYVVYSCKGERYIFRKIADEK